MSIEQIIFDRHRLRARRAAAAGNINDAGFLHREVRGRLLERLEDINREFETTLELVGMIPKRRRSLQAGSCMPISPQRDFLVVKG